MSSGAVPSTFAGGLKFGLGFALAMVPLVAAMFAGTYFLSRPATQNATVPIERVTNDLVSKIDVALNRMIDRLREIVEVTLNGILTRVDDVARANIERLREVSNDTVARIDERTAAVLQSTAGLMEQQFTRYTDSSVQSWRQNTDAVIARIVQLLDQQAQQLADVIERALRAALGSLLRQ